MLVINNGTVLTMDDGRSVYFGGHVVIDGMRITAVGPGSWSAPDASASAEVIDASGMIVMPGLIDLHYHTAVGKGLCDHLPLWESLEEFWYPSIRALDADSAYGYDDLVRASTSLLDSCARDASPAATAAAFDRATAYELAFWEMAYTRGASDGAGV